MATSKKASSTKVVIAKKSASVTTTETSPAVMTTSVMEAAGIKTALNQNDVTEVIAQEAYDKIQELLHNAPKLPSFEPDKDALTKLGHDFVKELVKKGIISEEQSKAVGINTKLESEKEGTYFDWVRLTTNETAKDVKVYLSTPTSWISYGTKEYTLIVTLNDIETEKVGGINITRTDSFRAEKKVKLPGYTKEEIAIILKDHSDEIRQLYKDIPVAEKQNQKSIGFDSLYKLARVTVNKNIIKNQAPEVTAQLQKLFDIKF